MTEESLKIFKMGVEKLGYSNFKQVLITAGVKALENSHLMNKKVLITLKTDENFADKVVRIEPFNIKISGCGTFPNNNHIKVIWIGVESDELLVQLHDKLDNEFAAIGFDKDKKFSTHLTIGRMKSAKGKNQVRDVIEEFENVEIGEMNISNIAFKKSTLKPSGPIYENLKTYDL